MAYVEFEQSIEPGAESAQDGESGSARPITLGQDEWAVVELARKDGLWSLNPDGLPQRLVRALFGIRPPLPLANERLEALRRFVVIAWNRGSVGAHQMCDLLSFGFSRADARQILHHLSRQRQLRSWPRGIA